MLRIYALLSVNFQVLKSASVKKRTNIRYGRKMMRMRPHFVTKGFEKKKRRGFGAKGREEQKMGGKAAGD